jgi:hypothetical protein
MADKVLAILYMVLAFSKAKEYCDVKRPLNASYLGDIRVRVSLLVEKPPSPWA